MTGLNSNFKDKKNYVIKLMYRNVENTRFPIIITLDKNKGIFLEMSNMSCLVKKRNNFDDYITDLVELIIKDKIITCAFYSSRKDC